jgi:peptidoglycan/xylan/chitin deacetylase (PgdA/CDA1 family)
MAIPRLNAIYDALHIKIPPYVHPLAIFLVLLFLLGQIFVGHLLQQSLNHKKGAAQKHFADRLVFPIIVIFAIDGILGIITGLLTTITPAALLQPTFQRFFPLPTPAAVTVINLSISQNRFTIPVKSPAPTPINTPKPLTFAEMNTQYGPCTRLPTLMYHHIEDLTQAKQLGQSGLAVSPTYFDLQMSYLAAHGYATRDVGSLVDFFNAGTVVPAKTVLLTFDDGYSDFYTNAFPILKKYNLKSIMFLPTGLVGNPGYLTWAEIQEMSSSGMVLFANHTWSHKPMSADDKSVDMEINTADRELSDHGLNSPKVFAYPYGTVGSHAENTLQSLGYRIAFTTHTGSILCKKMALTLPRVRIGNATLASYGF